MRTPLTWLVVAWLLLASSVWAATVGRTGYEYQDQPYVMINPASGAAPVIDWSQSSIQFVTLTAATVTFTFLPPGTHRILTLVVTQDASGLRAVSLPASVKCTAASCTTATITSGKSTLYQFIYDGSTYWNTLINLNL